MINLFGNVLTSIFAPLLTLPFSLFMIFMSILITFLLTLASIFLIDRKKFQEVKQRIQELQKKAKELQKEKSEKNDEIMKEILKLTHEQMIMNMKPMFVSIFVVIIFLPWIASISLYNAEFDENGKGFLELKYFTQSPISINFEVKENSIVINDKTVNEGDTFRIDRNWFRVNYIDHEKKVVNFGAIVKTPFPLPFFSYGFGWLMWYIVCSSFFLYLFRRIAGIG